MITRRRFLKYLGGLGVICVLPGALPIAGKPIEVFADSAIPKGFIYIYSTLTGDNRYYHHWMEVAKVSYWTGCQWKEIKEWKS